MKVRILFSVLIIACFLIPVDLIVQQSDNENGTFTNPVIWSDFPDNDVIRVGDTYYMVTTTMHVFPGVTIMKSKDLVNWEYATNALPRLDIHPFYSLDGGTRYSHGQWATSIRYHNGSFFLLFVTMDEGGFLMTATDPEGEWKLMKLPKAYYDPGLFFDDDGKVYVVHEASVVFLTEVNPDDFSPKTESRVIFEGTIRRGLEGHHMYKINGYYYILSTYGGGDGFEACFRSKNIYGPYEEKIILRDDMNLTGKGVHQGGIVQTQSGEWWMIIFQDRDGVGRCPTLQPVEWTDGWPMIGKGGKAVVTYRKPETSADHPVKVLPTSDEFSDPELGLQWQWNHNPVDSKWSLTESKGWLRLKTATVTDDLKFARNTLTQRIFGPYSTGTVEMDVGNMKNGDIAGLCIFQDPYAYVAVKMGNNSGKLIMFNKGSIVDSVLNFQGDKIWFRAHAVTITDRASFYYSTDNKTFKKLGNNLDMKYRLTVFTGNKFCLFNYATKETGGYVDINWFRMQTKQGPPNLYKASEMIEAEMYDEIYQADTEICRDIPDMKDQDITKTENGSWLKFDQIDFGRGVRNFYARVASENEDARIELHLGDVTGPVIGTCSIEKTGDWQMFKTVTCPVKKAKGKQTLVLKFTGGEGNLVNINWFSFKKNPYTIKNSTE
ncbi:MAG: family 43 glycosylhydrolase [Bacteroidales bacterium]|nr:family 43 glycosylhydrolase [Bacteroidales bacterium]